MKRLLVVAALAAGCGTAVAAPPPALAPGGPVIGAVSGTSPALVGLTAQVPAGTVVATVCRGSGTVIVLLDERAIPFACDGATHRAPLGASGTVTVRAGVLLSPGADPADFTVGLERSGGGG